MMAMATFQITIEHVENFIKRIKTMVNGIDASLYM
ncbi:hypothetical protein lpg0108 [Legionella pneumophila subsp. pneumophila str. Philadelphia 1]|uniref:Uncharacterized protein n=1 Tax=Legionella pneumophila subsp. pneumophila (strain Philadelphia 1 / ATCC 33152 / DSM 7513) TaxID=272624 RepID=Q5ZZA3_LEGPH|nr:hypothetical protein lpg0108 [Legionella pneumophila subsp. pneumophila str. Philadelphia 1]AEW50396.1 hypothetical protein lp12_0109 [Legionella pneumophila subsp. pneumophila ATCC 43290]